MTNRTVSRPASSARTEGRPVRQRESVGLPSLSRVLSSCSAARDGCSARWGACVDVTGALPNTVEQFRNELIDPSEASVSGCALHVCKHAVGSIQRVEHPLHILGFPVQEHDLHR